MNGRWDTAKLIYMASHGRNHSRDSLKRTTVHFDCTGKPSGVQVRVIHGYGSTGEGGVLRKRIRSFCQRLEDHLEVTAGEEIDGNRGCTVVNPIRRLPDMHEMLAEQIRVYCKRPRSRSKVLGDSEDMGSRTSCWPSGYWRNKGA